MPKDDTVYLVMDNLGQLGAVPMLKTWKTMSREIYIDSSVKDAS